MAQVIVALGQRDNLFADEFAKYADVLSRLSRDQILVAGRFHSLLDAEVRAAIAAGEKDEVKSAGIAWQNLQKELIPNQFHSTNELLVVMGQLVGTGLVLALSAFGGLTYRPSPLLYEVAKLADFEKALADE